MFSKNIVHLPACKHRFLTPIKLKPELMPWKTFPFYEKAGIILVNDAIDDGLKTIFHL